MLKRNFVIFSGMRARPGCSATHRASFALFLRLAIRFAFPALVEDCLIFYKKKQTLQRLFTTGKAFSHLQPFAVRRLYTSSSTMPNCDCGVRLRSDVRLVSKRLSNLLSGLPLSVPQLALTIWLINTANSGSVVLSARSLIDSSSRSSNACSSTWAISPTLTRLAVTFSLLFNVIFSLKTSCNRGDSPPLNFSS